MRAGSGGGSIKTIRNHLAGNTTGATGDGALAEQLINIIFCKIYDERFTPPDEMVTFRAGIDEEPHEVTQRLRNLFDKVKEKYEEVIDFSDKINIDENSIRYIVGVLQNYSLTESERDVVADAFEIFIGHALKGSQGQFFTPRNVVKLLVEIIQPETTDSVIDPACGSGGFLIESLRYIWKKIDDQSKELGWDDSFTQAEKMSVAMKNIKGLDKDDFLVKVTKAYMAILGDGKGGVFCEDALDKPLYWREKARQSIALESFDIVLTNPPFGREVKVVGIEKLSQYELAAMWYKEGENWEVKNKQRKDVRSEIIFIERCLQLLKDGGRMGIVLPETFFHAPKSRFVMQFMERHNIQWIVDLPHNTFRPHNNAKCVVIILQKNRKQAESIKFSVAEEMGHDHQGRPIYRWDHSEQKVDKSQVWDDIQVIMDELGSESSQYTFSEDSSTVKSRSIFVPRYYWKTRDQEVSEIAKNNGYNLIPLSELVDEKAIITFDGHGSPRSEYKGKGEIPYVRVKDIVNWEIYKDPTSSIPYHVYAEMKRDKISRAGDILYVRRGSYRIGSVAMLSPFDTETLLTRELLTLRVNPHNKYGLTSHYLLYLLSHRLVAMQSFNKVLIETTLPNISDRWKELKLPFFAREEARDETILQIKSVIDAKWDAVKRLNDLKKEHGELLT